MKHAKTDSAQNRKLLATIVILLALGFAALMALFAFLSTSGLGSAQQQAQNVSGKQAGIGASMPVQSISDARQAPEVARSSPEERSPAESNPSDATAGDSVQADGMPEPPSAQAPRNDGTISGRIPPSPNPSSFSVGACQPQALGQGEKNQLLDAARAVENAGYACGFVFLDLQSGCGIAYRANEPIYTASSFKAPFVYYLLKHYEGESLPESLRTNAESAILISDNDSYDAITFPHGGQDYIDWQEGYGIAYDGWTPYYPFASAASMTAIWADMYRYMQTGSEDAKWFASLLENTNLSFVRIALEEEGVRVWNKGGWLADEEYNAVADCAIVREGDRDYLMVVLSNQPSYGEAHERVENIVRALYRMRSLLGMDAG